MHYTALVGTMYYPGDSHTGPPTPVLPTAALIGIISAIVVAGCIILFVIVAKAKIENSKLPFQKKPQKRLILDTIFFDTNGRILVKVDGVVPMKEILSELPENVTFYYEEQLPCFASLTSLCVGFPRKVHLQPSSVHTTL